MLHRSPAGRLDFRMCDLTREAHSLSLRADLWRRQPQVRACPGGGGGGLFGGNQAVLLQNGGAFFSSILEAIRGASSTCDDRGGTWPVANRLP